MAKLSWGIKTTQQHTTYDALLEIWREADRTPAFEHAWLFDHFAPIQGDLDGPCFEGWTLLAALAAQTTRLRLGLMVVRASEHGNSALRARRAHPAPRRSLRDHPAALHAAAHRLRRAVLPAHAGALRAEAAPEAVSPLSHWRRRRAAHPARRGALRRRLDLHTHRCG